MMTLSPTFGRGIRLVFHILGLSCIGGAVFLQSLVFSGIVLQGYFMAVEQNVAVLTIEIALTAFALLYFAYTYQRLIRQVR
jgi:hypothetical protein